jgi:hypothetical protein
MTRNGKITFSLCAYEALALASRDKLPTLTTMQRHAPILGAGLVAVLAGHFIANDDARTCRYLGWLK